MSIRFSSKDDKYSATAIVMTLTMAMPHGSGNETFWNRFRRGFEPMYYYTAPHKYIKIATDRYYHVATEEVRSELATSGIGGRVKRFRI